MECPTNGCGKEEKKTDITNYKNTYTTAITKSKMEP